MLEVFVVERLILDLGALILGLHGAQNTLAVAYAFELLENRLLYCIREPVHEERSLEPVLIHGKTELAIDDHLYGHGAAH